MEIIPQTYERPFLHALVLQLLLTCVCMCGGPPELVMPALLYTSFGYWVGAVTIMVRRPREPTTGDIDYVRWGLPKVVILGSIVAWLYWGVYYGGEGRHSW